MRSRIVAVVFMCLLSCSGFARAPRARSHRSDADYASALTAANRFLHAWQVEDHETEILMLSDSARRQTSGALLQEFFSPGPQAAYEIAHGKRLRTGAYSFPVVLFGASVRPRFSNVVLIQMSKNDWAVDKIPG